MMDSNDSPKAVLSEMKDVFIKSVKNLFIVSKDCFREYDTGIYGYIIARPTKAISLALGIQKEVLVLLTNFENLQVRTIDAAKKFIDEGEGRFETNVALIVHKDLGGDIKLKNWGREVGLSILPIYFEDGLPESDELKRLLCYELYSHDPFDVTGPVSNDANFYGRKSEAQDLARKLQLGQIRSLLGVRKIGKTSIINRIINDLSGYDCISIMIDCSRDEVWSMNAEQLMEAISVNVKKAVDNGERYLRLDHLPVYDKRLYESSALLEKASREANKPIIIFFDEIDYITPSSPTNPSWQKEFNKFWRNLRVAYQETGRSTGLLSIVIGGVSSKWFTVGEVNGIENSVLAFIPEEYLSPLPRGASIAMIKNIGRVAGLLFTDNAADLISEESADMPYWIRKACSFIHRHISVDSRPINIDVDRVMSFLETFINNEGGAIAEVALQHLFNIYPDLREAFDSVIIKKPGVEISSRFKNVLLRYGLIKEQNGIEVAGGMIKEGYMIYKEYVSASAVLIDATVKAAGSDNVSMSLGEWADEIAAISKRRNLLERKMREIAINFIKMDSLSNPAKKSAKDRILGVLPEKQRTVLSHMAADEIIQKYCWADLIKLYVGKEWKLFEKMIGDKNLFNLNASIINDRPDAHAKESDGADFALYRRALRYMEDMLAKLG